MVKKEIAPGIVVYSDLIDGHENLVNDIEEGMTSSGIEWFSATVIGGVDTKVRNTSSISVPFINGIDEEYSTLVDAFQKNIANLFYNTLVVAEKEYMASYGVYFSDHDNYQLLKYGKGQYFTNHIDDHPQYHRRLSSVYYLNDNYTGGEINFPRFEISYKPKANEMIIFPSTYVYNHSVSEVTEGTRYAVASWIK
jgi:predicted 2-oxoglutarate/Fe(II)-dependent dioxygenase YbiX